MGLRILVGKDDGGAGHDVAVFYDSTTGWAFGPVFGGVEGHERLEDPHTEANEFLAWMTGAEQGETLVVFPEGYWADSPRTDPRKISESGLERLYAIWAGRRAEEVPS